MKKERRFRVSCFAAGVPLNGSCEQHFAPRTEEKARFVFARERRKIGGEYGYVVLHRGNLKRHAYEIVARAETWTPLDQLTAKLTAFDDFDDLLNAKGHYFPTLNINKPGAVELADGYDEAQKNRFDSRRAFRTAW